MMLDPYMNAILIFAVKSVVLESIENERIINRFGSRYI